MIYLSPAALSKFIIGLMLSMCFFSIGCESHTSGVTQTETKTHIERLFNLYKTYVETKNRAPANEEALKEFAKGLSDKDKDERMIGMDLESIFVSPRDKEPFVVVYGQSLSPGGAPVAVIYEKTGVNGSKYAALSIGYAEEYDLETLNGYIPKKK